MTILTPILGVLGVGGIGAALFFIPGAMGAVAKLASAAVTFIVGLPWAKIWWLIPCAAFLIFGLIERHGKHVAEAKIPALQQQAANSHNAFLLEKKAFATEKASLDGALAQINDNNKRVEAAHAALLAAEKDAAAANARSDARYVATKGAVARLEASAAAKGGPPCVVSPEALKALGGL